MKRFIYLSACVLIASAIVSCNKLNDTYKAVDGYTAAGGNGKTLTYTLAAADFSSLPTTNYAKTSHNFSTVADANASIPTILNTKFFDYPNGSTGYVTYGNQPTLPDSLKVDETYALTITPTNDYLLLPGNKFNDFSVAQMLTWLPYKFGSASVGTPPAANTTYLLSWILFTPTGNSAPTTFPGMTVSTSGSTVTATEAFSYINGNWVADYTISPAQYAAVGRGYFLSTDGEAGIAGFINGILKTDASIMATAAVGSTQYVSYDYYVTTSKTHYQRVLAVTYNGTNWVPNAPNTLIFVKQNNTWIPDPSIYYTLTKADTQAIAASTIGSASARTNLGSFGDFSYSATGWNVADVNAAIIFILQSKFPTPTVNLNYKVTFLKYAGSDTPTTYVFVYDGTKWVPQQ